MKRFKIMILLFLMVFLAFTSTYAEQADLYNDGAWRVTAGGVLRPVTRDGTQSFAPDNILITGVRSAVTGYEYFLQIGAGSDELDGTGTQGNTRGIYVNLNRNTDTTVGDLNDIGIQVRVDNTADGNTAGNTLSGIDSQASNSSPGVISNLVGGTFTAYNKTGGGDVVSAIGLRASAKANYAVTTTLIGADIDLFRQSAVEPTSEYVMRVKNSSLTGGGCDAGIYIASTGSGEADDFVTGIDMSGATIDQAQIVLSSGAKIFSGTAANGDAVYAEVGAYDATGSIYLSTAAGAIYYQVANNGAAADWYKVTGSDAD